MRVPLAAFTGRGYWSICTSVTSSWRRRRGGISVFCTILIAMGLRVWLFVLTGTGVSAACGQVNSVCIAIPLLHTDVSVRACTSWRPFLITSNEKGVVAELLDTVAKHRFVQKISVLRSKFIQR